jgi:hypothetical protein
MVTPGFSASLALSANIVRTRRPFSMNAKRLQNYLGITPAQDEYDLSVVDETMIGDEDETMIGDEDETMIGDEYPAITDENEFI